jgi:PAS domain S-box-containing protein
MNEIFLTFPGNEMYGEVLQVILKEMKSDYGIFAYIDEEGAAIAPSLTRDVWEKCHVPEKSIVFPRDTWGNSIWGKAITEKRSICANEPFDVPEGHIPINRALGVPILYQGEVIGHFLVGNKETDYDDSDREKLEAIALSISAILNARIQRDRQEQRRKQAEQDLRESEAFYRSLYENISDCIFIIDVTPEGRFKFVSFNPAEERAVGMTTEQVANKLPEDLVPKDVAEHVNSRYRMCVEKRQTIHYEEVLDLPKGKMSFLTSLVPIEGPDGSIYRIIGVAKDITEQKSLQRQLVQAQKMESLGTLAGGIAHDFNNLLQVIVGYSDMLLFNKKPIDPDYERLNAMRHAGKNGAELAKRILAFSRRVEPITRPVNLNNEIVRVQKMLERTVPKMIRIEILLADNLMTVNADPGQMEQILLNLAVNAQYAMPDGGRLTIETANVTLDEDYSRAHLDVEPGRYVLLSVSDTGHGMDKEVLEHIFEPFYTTKGASEGTGLGLAMVFGIVKSHKGHITCYSQPGAGATFKIYLPAIVQETEQDVAVTQQMPAFGTEAILLVDDESSVRKLGEEMLRMAGYTVLTAANGREALEIYGSDPDRIGLVLLDLIMPEMGGKQCLEELLKINPRVKVVIGSGYSANGPTKGALASGAKGFVDKPYDIRQVLEVVRGVLDAE